MTSVISGSPGRGLIDSFALSCGRNNANVTNLWLRDANGIPLNLSPMIIPFSCRLIAISASTRLAETCDFDVYKQPVVRTGGIPAAGSRIARLSLAGADESSDDTLSVDLSPGDGIGVFARGTGISNPRVILWLVRN